MIALMPVICCRTASPRPIYERRSPARREHIRPRRCFVLGAQRGLYCGEPRVGVVLCAESDEIAAGVIGTAGLDQPARQLNSRQNGEREQDAGDSGDRKHRPPASRAGKRLVHKVSEKDADGDCELIGRDESPPLRGRGEFRRIKRGRDRRDADAKAGQEPAEDENRHIRRQSLNHRADDEKRRGGEERTLAAEMVGSSPAPAGRRAAATASPDSWSRPAPRASRSRSTCGPSTCPPTTRSVSLGGVWVPDGAMLGREGPRPRGRAALLQREPHPPGRLQPRRRAVLHRPLGGVRQDQGTVRQAARQQPGDPVPARRVAHEVRDAPGARPQDRLEHGSSSAR